MTRFRYLRDEFCLLACALYAINRWLVKPHVRSPFLRYHFNDLLLVPCALPLLLWMHRRLGLRRHDGPPEWGEIALYTAFWSVLFEVIGPRIIPWTTGDPWDAAAYFAGGLAAGAWWHRQTILQFVRRHEL